MLATLTHDLRDAARTLRRHRGVAASAIAILAVGIASSTGLFAVVDAVVLHPLPYAGADRLARIELLQPSRQPRPASVTTGEFLALRRASTLDDVYVRDSFTKTLAGSAFPESVWTAYYTGNALSLLDVKPAIGRVFTEKEAPVGPEPARVAVLSYPFWQRRFAGQRNAVGQTLQLNGEPFTVIGVAREDESLDATDVIVPLPMPFDTRETWPPLVRVKPGTPMATAEGELQTLFEQFAKTRADAFPTGSRVRLRRLIDEERGASYVPVLAALFVAAALLLLIGCANVTILLLARGRYRVHEISVRHALGASRARLVRLLF